MIFRYYCSILCDHMDSSGQNTGVGSLSLLQEVFPTQGLNPGLTHYRRILYQLSHQGSPGILEWVAYPFSSRSSNPGVKPRSPALQEDSLPTELPGRLCSLFYKNITSPFIIYCDFVFMFWEILYILDFFGFVYLKIFLSQNLEKIIWKSLNKILQPWYY